MDDKRDATDKERELEEHEREAQRREEEERGPEASRGNDPEADKPAPPTNIGSG